MSKTKAVYQMTMLLALLLLTAEMAAGASLLPVKLRCEYRDNPLGIDTATPRLSWELQSDERGQGQTAYQIRVASTKTLLEQGQADLWDSGRVASDEQNQVAYAGQPPASAIECHWSVQVWDKQNQTTGWSSPACWSMGLLQPDDWQASWITDNDNAQTKPSNQPSSAPLPLFRKAFAVNKTVSRAVLYVCGLGFHEVHLNGGPVTDAVLEPGWTNYRKTCLYSTYDVTARMTRGDNALGVMLGNGMYNVTGGRYVKFTGSFGPPKLLLHLRIEYADGSVDRVVSDASWKTTPGPITFSCIYGGEDYDARKEISAWDQPGLDESKWRSVNITDSPGGRMRSAAAPPIKVMESFTPAKITSLPNGAILYDLGQNFSGRPSLTVRGAQGATVKLIPGELLDEQGLASQRSSGSPVWFSYTLKGDGQETWAPRFSYYGFRYVQVEGARPTGATGGDPALPEIISLNGEFTHASAERVGEFACANPLVNQTHKLILAAIRSNFQSVLTDCPHREKLGWLEVSQLLADGIIYNFDASLFYAKIQQDMADSQTESGLVPDIAPEYTVFKHGFRDSPEWGSASIVNPWNVYQMYGDRRILSSSYDVMRRYADYLTGTSKNSIVSHGLGDWYDVGPNPPGESQLTAKGVTATATYYQDLSILCTAAALLDRRNDAQAYAERAAEVRNAFNHAYFKDKVNQYDQNSQTANAMPLTLGLVEDDRREAVNNSLVRAIEEAKFHVTAGDVGFSYLVRALTEAERGDILYQMVCQTDGPGYACQLAKGATALTEAWDASPASSNNHCMLGHIDGWFYRGLAGIRNDPAQPGFRHFILRPQTPDGLEWVKARYDSIRGPIVSEWRMIDGDFAWKVTIPPNTTARVYVPAKDANSVTENGAPPEKSPGLTSVRSDDGCTIFEAQSGQYNFISKR